MISNKIMLNIDMFYTLIKLSVLSVINSSFIIDINRDGLLIKAYFPK
jgi:hypothetical protein